MWKPYKSDYIQSFLHVTVKHVQGKKKFDCKRKRKFYFTLTSFQLQHWKNKDIDYLCQLYLLSLQWKLLTVDFLYSRHLSTMNFFLRDGWNGTQTLKMKPLCSGHFIANRSIQWTSNHITPYNWHRHILYKAFLARNVYIFYFWQCFTTLFKFSLIFILLFSWFNSLFRSTKM